MHSSIYHKVVTKHDFFPVNVGGGGGGQGYTTTTLPTTWMNDSSRVLCAFEHVSLLEGTMVLISEDAPVCCCPRAFSQKDQLGERRD